MHRGNKWLSGVFYLLIIFAEILSANAASFDHTMDNGKLTAGKWRGYIMRADGHVIPFNFDLQKSAGKIIIHVNNGIEHLLVDNVYQQGDSVFIDMPFFDSRFAVRILDSAHWVGRYIKNYGDRLMVIPFRAISYFADRASFVTNKKAPLYNISGRWSVLFKGVKDSTQAVGEFKQSGYRVKGTFLTITGDYRFLEGKIDGDSLKLSTFDGGHAYAFESKILNNKRMTGFFYAGATSVETWVADKNEQAKLPDEYSLTRLKDSANAYLHFKFRDLNGHMISLSDPEYRNKVVIIQIMGSWCPNCMDETRFLAPWFIRNKSRGIE